MATTVTGEDRMALARVGFFLCRGGFIPEAEAIFKGLGESAPDRDGPAAGLALCLIIKGDSNAAIKLLDSHLAKGKACAIPGELCLYKLLALGMDGRLREAEALRGEMETKGFAGFTDAADSILADLKRIKGT